MITLTIDGQQIQVKEGTTVLEAAKEAGVYIPTLCYYPDLAPYGACRLCIVEIEGMRGFPTSCTTPVTDGMVVQTNTPVIQGLRRDILELTISEHPLTCLTCSSNGRCELQEVTGYVGINQITLPYIYKNLPIDTGNPFFERDYNLCILCGRCIRVCGEIRGNGVIAFVQRGSQTIVGTAFNKSLKEVGCQFCGACVDSCPTGALIERNIKGQGLPDYSTTTTCPYCGVGCQLEVFVKSNEIMEALPIYESVNEGQACVKGRFGIAEFVHHPDRLKTPLIKRNGRFEEATWDEALDLITSKLKLYQGNEVAVISSAKCTNEDNYILQKFGRAVLKTNNVDHCARLCHAPTVAGLVQSFGSGAMTNSINEIRDAQCILAIGTNTTSAHPVIALEIKKAVSQGAKLIVANPRRINLCRYADYFLQQAPGSDVALLMGMMKIIYDEGLHDASFIEQRCENFGEFKEALKAFDIDFVAQTTGIPAEKIIEAARIYATNSPATILYSMGITQHSHGTDNVLATANLAMLTGNMGKRSAGVNPLRGQNNVQGACDLGALPNVYPGYQAVAKPEVKDKFESGWGVSLSPVPGLAITEVIPAVEAGQVKAIYLMGENPALSEPDANHAMKILEGLDFLVVQDIFLTETAQIADVVLPAASFAEKDGTFTNTERKIQRVRKIIEPIGDSRADWLIVCQLAQRMGAKGFDFDHPSQIMDEIARLTPSYGGISYDRIEDEGLQWPCPTSDHPGTPILHTQVFARGKGCFKPLEYKPPMELPDEEFPLILTTERSLYHFHTGTMTRKVAGLNQMLGEGWVEINPTDAKVLGITHGDKVKVISRRGEIEAKADVTNVSPKGVVAMNFHFAESPANVITNPVLDPVSKIPELKVCAVRIEK